MDGHYILRGITKIILSKIQRKFLGRCRCLFLLKSAGQTFIDWAKKPSFLYEITLQVVGVFL